MMTGEITVCVSMPRRARPDRQVERRDGESGGHLAAVADAVDGDVGIPRLAGGDDGVQLLQNGRGDHGLGLGGGELVGLACGQMLVAGGVDVVAALGAPDRPPGGQTQGGSALTGELGPTDERAGQFSLGVRGRRA
jgi:hypothetical protein